MKVERNRPGLTKVMQDVLDDLELGANSMVGPPGLVPTVHPNFFADPGKDVPQILDALASEIRSGHMSGPHDSLTFPVMKINGFLSIPRSDGGSRQVGNLSAPKGISFNDGVPPESLLRWKVNQTTSKTVSHMIFRAGKGARLSCNDIVGAYKLIPVSLQQRVLQGFSVLGKTFVDERLVFGDAAACLLFDRLHHCIQYVFVRDEVYLPTRWQGRTIDDIPTVVPPSQSKLLDAFNDGYHASLTRLGIRYALEDPNRKKSFFNSSSGELLGIWFNSEELTWSLPQAKAKLLARQLDVLCNNAVLDYNMAAVICGKLGHVAQMSFGIRLLMGPLLSMAAELQSDPHASPRTISEDLLTDIRTVSAIVKTSLFTPFLIGNLDLQTHLYG